MAYTPTNWQTGDIITAEKLNKMDNGWGIQNTQLFSETVTTASDGVGTSAQLTYDSEITSDTLTITFDGTDYSCTRIDMDITTNTDHFYGGFTEQGPDFSEYPFVIDSNSERNTIFTATPGTYTVAAYGSSIVVNDDFAQAVAKADKHDFQVVIGKTTWAEANEALLAGKNVYLMYNLAPPFVDKVLFLRSAHNSNDQYLLYGVHFVYSSSEGTTISEIHLGADTEDGVLYLA